MKIKRLYSSLAWTRNNLQSQKTPVVIIILILVNITAMAADHQVQIYDNRIVPEVVVLNQGDKITWSVISGRHSLKAKNGDQAIQFTSPLLNPGDKFSLSIDLSVGESQYMSTADEGMLAALVVEPALNDYVVDERINANYYNPETPGQGLLFEYVPSTDVLIAYWFTYKKDSGAQQWMLANGTVQGNQATLTVYEPVGGQLANPTPPENTVWGEMTVVFKDCLQGDVFFNSSNEQHAGQFPIVRLYAAEVCANTEFKP